MNYNYKSPSQEKSQDVVLKNRHDLHLTGIVKLVSLNVNEFILDTILGMMSIKGSNLEMESLDIENGLLHVKGEIYQIEYAVKPNKPKEKSFFAKVFK